MFSKHRLLKVAVVCVVAAGLALAALTTARAQSSRAESAASYFARGSEWQARGEFDRVIADFAQCVALKPEMKSSLEQRINQLQAQLKAQIRTLGH
jgi:hypothetical protein